MREGGREGGLGDRKGMVLGGGKPKGRIVLIIKLPNLSCASPLTVNVIPPKFYKSATVSTTSLYCNDCHLSYSNSSSHGRSVCHSRQS